MKNFLRFLSVYSFKVKQSQYQTNCKAFPVLDHISFKQITNWVHRFEKEGVEGLKDKKGRGRRSALSAEQLARIKELVLQEAPTNYGFQSEKWTGPLLVQ